MVSQNIFFHGFSNLKNTKYAHMSSFWGKYKVKICVWGVCMHKKMYFENYGNLLFGGPIHQIMDFGDI